MKEQELLKLMDEYFEEFGDVNVILAMEQRLGIDFAIEMLKGRNGSKIKEMYFGANYDDAQPQYIYE